MNPRPRPKNPRSPRFSRTRRFIYRAAVITSLLIGVAMSYGWWWSQGRVGGVGYVVPKTGTTQRFWQASLCRARVVVGYFAVAHLTLQDAGFDLSATRLEWHDDDGSAVFTAHGSLMLGFGIIHNWDGGDLDGTALMLPAWFIILLALLLPCHCLLMTRRSARRARTGCCAKCGYDLRGQPAESSKCPECGWESES